MSGTMHALADAPSCASRKTLELLQGRETPRVGTVWLLHDDAVAVLYLSPTDFDQPAKHGRFTPSQFCLLNRV